MLSLERKQVLQSQSTVSVRQASERDCPAVVSMYENTVEWLRGQGTDQWHRGVDAHGVITSDARQRIAADIALGNCWLGCSGGQVVASLTLDEQADEDFWFSVDDPASALYVHRLMVARTWRGQQVGAQMLRWAEREAASRGFVRVRLDAWLTNARLHDYYRSQGYRRVRLVEDPGRLSGVCFDRASGQRSALAT